MKIRKTQYSDAEQWVKLKNNVWRSAYAHIFPTEVFDDLDQNAQEKIEKFATRTLNQNGDICLVVEDKGKIVALADAKILSLYDHYKNLGYADLCAIYIYPEYQHLGLGKKLFDIITKEFQNLGCRKMVIGVLADNAKARKAYEKWGGVLDDYQSKIEKLGKEYNEVFYLYELN